MAVTKSQQQRTLILDIGDVLCHWSIENLTAISPQSLHAITRSPTWSELERGCISETEAILAISKELSLDPDAIDTGLMECRKTLRVDQELTFQLKELKAELGGHLKVYAMSNIAKEHFAFVKTVLSDWDLFDGEFLSFEVGMTKPDLQFHQNVLDSLNLSDPSSAIFVDDKVANVNAARSFGIHGIVFDSSTALIRQLRNLLMDPVARARRFMTVNAHKHTSCIQDVAPVIFDHFAQFLIQIELNDDSVISLSPPGASNADVKSDIRQARSQGKAWNFFNGPPVGTTKTYPDDVDDTALAFIAFSPPAASANPILDRIVANRHDKDGLIMIYLGGTRPRVCPFIMLNAVRALYRYGRGAEVQPELEHIRRVLLKGGHIDGSEHYLASETFLYFLACLIEDNPTAPEVQSLRKPTVEALRQRVNRPGDSFVLASRVLACQKLDVETQSDLASLKELQECDGGWELAWISRFGRSKKMIGNRGIPTAWAIKALEYEAQP
ncbi:hypothetical protein J4E86_000060 [Alternaria arbusti]|uniref:uncharacterized protein n=1 Tax=Alternaria arbusti TaxID=232088 RepID=UPI00221E710A|nr:uncharacterized protein J4E86_000060 [Alternaria arbusti]KAI4961035.1 hypothetical protein J4E86_000060 [Alternaria arbusti]